MSKFYSNYDLVHWVNRQYDKHPPIDTEWGRYFKSPTEEIIKAIKRINSSTPCFGVNDILISLVVRFNTDIRLAKLFKKVDNKEIPSLFNDNDYVKRYTQRPYIENGLLRYNSWAVIARNRFDGPVQCLSYGTYRSEPFRFIDPFRSKPKLKIRFTRSDKPGYVNFVVKERPGIDEWENVYE